MLISYWVQYYDFTGSVQFKRWPLRIFPTPHRDLRTVSCFLCHATVITLNVSPQRLGIQEGRQLSVSFGIVDSFPGQLA